MPCPSQASQAASHPLATLAAALAEDMAAVGRLIRERMASADVPRISEVAAHVIEAGGKRIRPLLTLASARLCGYAGDDHIKLAATVEFIHTATLLHDDVVDGSTQRRGRPSANFLWDNKSSVLVGDYLFARAFQLMVEPQNLRALAILADAAATIAEGEVLQLVTQQKLDTTEATYRRVIRGKTAALFAAATRIGAVIAGRPAHEEEALFAYGDALGIAFQIVDDWLDYGGAGADIGKNLGDDFREGKVTLPIILALSRVTAEERAFFEKTLAAGVQEPGDFERACAILSRTGAMEATRAAAFAEAARARAALLRLPAHPLREHLAALVDFVVKRTS